MAAPREVRKYLHFGQNEFEFINENSECDVGHGGPARNLLPGLPEPQES
jgi:hypothetical protein